MKIKILVMLIGLAGVLSSCEENVTGVQLPYKEQLVIRAILQDSALLSNVRIERTLPPLEEYSVEKALVTNAIVTVNDGEKDYVLSYSDGYYNCYDLTIKAGKTYKMTAKWKNKTAYAETTVPLPPKFDGFGFDIVQIEDYWEAYTSVRFYTYVQAEEISEKSVYWGGVVDWYGRVNYYNGSYDGKEIIKLYSDRDNSGKIKVYLNELSYSNNRTDTTELMEIFNQYEAVVTAYDQDFYKYYLTRWNGESSEGIFGTAGNNVEWNVKGDGIGMFIGRSETRKKL